VKRKFSGREKFLMGVFGIAAVVLLRNWMGQPLNLGQAPDADAAEARSFGEPPVVDMAMLALDAAEFDPRGRNLFDYYTPPKPVRKPKPKPPRKPVVRNQRDYKPPPPPAPTRATAPMPAFRYLGHVGPKENLIGAFKGDGDMQVVRIGGVVERDFKLLEFKYDAVVLGYVDEKWEGQTAELKMSER